MRFVVAQLGARRHYAVPIFLHRAGALRHFFTDWCANMPTLRAVDRVWRAPLRPAPLRRLLARRVPELPDTSITCFPAYALARIVARADAMRDGAVRAHYARANSAFCQRVAARLPPDADAVYSFNGAALEILRAARARGWSTVLDQTSAPVRVERARVEAEYERYPGWEPRTNDDGWEALAEREEAEWRLANRIVCGSAFAAVHVRATGGADLPCTVVPYGLPHVPSAPPDFPAQPRGPLRVLYAGAIRLQKGVQYLAEAARILGRNSVEVRATGPIRLAPQGRRALAAHMELLGPVPRSEMAAQYRWAQVFAFPSLCEGSANVCYEALSHGVPVVASSSAGSVVRDGIEGSIVPPGDAGAIAEALARFADDRGWLQAAGRAARLRAESFTWAVYARSLLAAIEDRADETPLHDIPPLGHTRTGEKP